MKKGKFVGASAGKKAGSFMKKLIVLYMLAQFEHIMRRAVLVKGLGTGRS
jgi:hypothetical protein